MRSQVCLRFFTVHLVIKCCPFLIICAKLLYEAFLSSLHPSQIAGEFKFARVRTCARWAHKKKVPNNLDTSLKQIHILLFGLNALMFLLFFFKFFATDYKKLLLMVINFFVIQFLIHFAFIQQFTMRSDTNNFTFIYNNNFTRLLCNFYTMRDIDCNFGFA